MVEVMGVDILDIIPKVVGVYMNRSSVNEMIEFILLLNQIMSTFKVTSEPLFVF